MRCYISIQLDSGVLDSFLNYIMYPSNRVSYTVFHNEITTINHFFITGFLSGIVWKGVLIWISILIHVNGSFKPYWLMGTDLHKWRATILSDFLLEGCRLYCHFSAQTKPSVPVSGRKQIYTDMGSLTSWIMSHLCLWLFLNCSTQWQMIPIFSYLWEVDGKLAIIHRIKNEPECY